MTKTNNRQSRKPQSSEMTWQQELDNIVSTFEKSLLAIGQKLVGASVNSVSQHPAKAVTPTKHVTQDATGASKHKTARKRNTDGKKTKKAVARARKLTLAIGKARPKAKKAKGQANKKAKETTQAAAIGIETATSHQNNPESDQHCQGKIGRDYQRSSALPQAGQPTGDGQAPASQAGTRTRRANSSRVKLLQQLQAKREAEQAEREKSSIIDAEDSLTSEESPTLL